FQAEDGIRDYKVTGVQTCALPIFTQRRFAGAGRFVIFQLWRDNRQLVLIQRAMLSILPVFPNNREGLAPIALPRKKPVAQFVVRSEERRVGKECRSW